MTSLFKRLCRDQRGATVVETAIVLPILLMFIFGIFHLGMIFKGQASITHALGEGARMATLYPTPNDDAIYAKMQDSLLDQASIGHYEIDRPVRSGLYMTLKVRYIAPMNFFLVSLPTVVISKEKVVYTASKVS